MKVFIISRGYPSEKYKMNGIFEFDQAKALKKSGHEVVFLAADIRSIRRWRKWGFEQQVISGIPVLAFNVPVGRLPHRIRNMFMRHSIKKLIGKAKRQFGKPDIVHAHFYHVGYVCGQLKDRFQAPLVLTEHSSEVNKENLSTRIKRQAAYAYAQADGLICVSDKLSNHLKKTFNVNPVSIPNIVDTSLFNIGVEQDNQKYGFHFVTTALLRPIKGLDIEIQAFHDSFKETEDVYLTILGDGPERTKLENLKNRLGLDGIVFLMGMQPRNVIAQKLRQSDCFVLTSRAETFGVAYIEALASGLPVIATKCGGPESFVTEDNGIMVDIDSIRQIETAMRYMHINANKYDRQAISRKTKEKYSDVAIARKLFAYYQQVCKKQ